MITAQKCNIKMKKCKILPFQNHQFHKNSVFGPFFVDYPLLPADMINFLLNTVSTINFALEKVVRTWGEPQKKSFFTNVWSLSQICQNMVSQGTKLLGTSNDAQNAFRWPKIFGLSYNFNHTCPIMHLKDKKVAFVLQNSQLAWKKCVFRFFKYKGLSSFWDLACVAAVMRLQKKPSSCQVVSVSLCKCAQKGF